jgi:hypothetical protein
MMITNRIKGSMMMAAFTAVMTFAAMGCTDEEPKTPAEQLLQAAQDGNKRIDAVLAHHEVLTTQIVSETLAPIDDATEGFNAELISWQDVQVDPKFQSHELEIYAKAGVEIANLTAKLDAQGFALGSAVPPDGSDSCTSGSDCECSEVAPAPTDITREGVDSDPAGMGDLTEKVYWPRVRDGRPGPRCPGVRRCVLRRWRPLPGRVRNELPELPVVTTLSYDGSRLSRGGIRAFRRGGSAAGAPLQLQSPACNKGSPYAATTDDRAVLSRPGECTRR